MKKKAAESKARVIHLPETVLSGYERTNLTASDWDNWQCLEASTKEIVNLAGELGLWVVLGSCRKIVCSKKPANCLHIISDAGRIIGTYDKQKLSFSDFIKNVSIVKQ